MLFTRHVPGASFAPEIVTPAAAALELFDNTVVADSQPERATAAVARLARTVSSIRSERPEAEAIAEAILDLVDRSEVPA